MSCVTILIDRTEPTIDISGRIVSELHATAADKCASHDVINIWRVQQRVNAHDLSLIMFT